ncbi:MAG: hypothetical protein QGH40_17900 [bacterium]|nr:hypothetical protein [bacterium]
MAILFVLVSCPVSRGAESGSESGTINVIDTMTNYNVKLRVAKSIWNPIKEARNSGQPIDWQKIKSEAMKKSILTHLAFEQGSTWIGAGIKYSLMGVAPPYGLAAASLFSETFAGLGGAIGFEMSGAIENGSDKPFLEIVGRSMKNIDATNFAGRVLGSVAGTVLGQALCPYPFLGVMAGGMVGSLVGGTLANYLVKTEFGKRLSNRFQKSWNNTAQWLIDFSQTFDLNVKKTMLKQKLNALIKEREKVPDNELPDVKGPKPLKMIPDAEIEMQLERVGKDIY